MTAGLLPVPKARFFDAAGDPLSGGKVYTYSAGTTTPKASYTDYGAGTPNANPVILDANGEANIWLSGNYKIKLTNSADVQQWVVDNVQDVQGAIDAATTAIYAAFANTSDVTKGDALVGVKQPFTGAVARTQHTKNIESISVKDFGATGDGVTDDTNAIQLALTAAGVGGTVLFPTGRYFVSATLTALSNQQIIGQGANSTVITRTGNYGDTLALGVDTPGNHAGAARVSGFWFELTPAYSSGSTTLTNKATSGAHVRVVQGQFCIIENCWMQRMPYSVRIDGGSLISVVKCDMSGVWDPVNVGCQEGIANIYLDASANNPTLIVVDDCYIAGGGASSARNYTYSCTDGDVVKNGVQSVGSKYGLFSTGTEGLTVLNSYFGGNALYGIYSAPVTAGGSLEWRITGSFFDSSGGPSCADIYFGSQDATKYIRGCTITGNTFNGEGYNQYAIYEANGADLTVPAVSLLSITGNTFLSYAGTAIWSYAMDRAVISDNSFTEYNVQNIGTTDQAYIAAMLLNTNTSNVTCDGNNISGTYAKAGVRILSTRNVRQSGTMFSNVTIAGQTLTGVVPTLGVTSLIGVLRGANFNTTADQIIPIILDASQKYAVTDIWVTNASTSLTTAVGGVYTAAAKAGTAVVANTQVYTACSAATGIQRATIATAGLVSTFTANPLYLSLTTPQGGAATGDIYVRGVLLT